MRARRIPRTTRALAAAAIPALAAFLCAGCSLSASAKRGLEARSTLADPDPASRDVAVAPFTSVLVEGALDVEIRVGSPHALAWRGDEERLPELAAEVRDGTLLLHADPATPWRDGPRAIVALPELDVLTAAGGGWISVGGLDAPRLVVRLRGAGDVLLRGRVGELVVEDTGAGDVDADALVVGPPRP